MPQTIIQFYNINLNFTIEIIKLCMYYLYVAKI